MDYSQAFYFRTYATELKFAIAANNCYCVTIVIHRRIFWNFFRLENEHLNNCGDFRVVRDIAIHPLDPTELPPDDEEDGAEPVLRRWQERRISEALVDVSLVIIYIAPIHTIYVIKKRGICLRNSYSC